MTNCKVKVVMDDLDNFLKRQTIDPQPHVHQELLKRYVYRSMSQEGLGMADALVVEQILQYKCETLEYRDTLGFVKAYQYLHELSQCDDAGLLDNNVIMEVHRILMYHRSHLCTVGKYSERERIAEFEGTLHFYPNPLDMEETIQMLIDDYNHRWFAVNRLQTVDSRKALEDLIHLTAWLVYKFLELHPFGDGNGRTIRLLYTYIMESYGFPFQVSPMCCTMEKIYSIESEHFVWCRILRNVGLKGNLEELEQHMFHSLSTSCKEYDALNKTN